MQKENRYTSICFSFCIIPINNTLDFIGHRGGGIGAGVAEAAMAAPLFS